MTRPDEQALEVLRAVWSAQGQDPGAGTDLADALEAGKSCKRMRDVGFDDLAGGDGDLRAAWRETLRREGKLDPDGGSVADIVLGRAQAR